MIYIQGVPPPPHHTTHYPIFEGPKFYSKVKILSTLNPFDLSPVIHCFFQIGTNLSQVKPKLVAGGKYTSLSDSFPVVKLFCLHACSTDISFWLVCGIYQRGKGKRLNLFEIIFFVQKISINLHGHNNLVEQNVLCWICEF